MYSSSSGSFPPAAASSEPPWSPAIRYRTTDEAHELFSRLCPWENTRVAPVGIVNAAANCARRRPLLALARSLLNIAFFRPLRCRYCPSPRPFRKLSALRFALPVRRLIERFSASITARRSNRGSRGYSTPARAFGTIAVAAGFRAFHLSRRLNSIPV